MSAANSVNIKKFNSTLKMKDQGIPLPPPLPPKVGIVKQGIVSILGSDSTERLNKAASIRRTLSADMSSKKWLSQNGFFSPMKKIASSEELIANNDHFSSSSEEEEDHHELIKSPGQDDVWRSIQNNNNKNKEPITTSVDVWSSILSQKKEESPTEQLPPPYIHPLVKRSSSLTEKSLEICTESLGSETGSDQNFSSYPPSETELGDTIDEEKEDQQQQEEIFSESFEEVPVVVKYNNKRSSSSTVPKSFPPPITSLAREDKPCVHMQSHRQNGRLILEAVSVPPQNLFRAQRLDGRLLLTLVATSETEDCDQGVKFQKVFDDNIEGFEYDETPHLDYDGDDGSEEEEEYEDDEEEEEKENGTKGMQIVLEQNPRMSNGRMNVNTSTLMMKQLMGLHKKDHLTWSNNFNLIVNDVPQSLPPPTHVSHMIQSTNIPLSPTSASFNAYEYFWRKNPTVAATIVNSPPTTKNNYNDKNQVVQAANYSTTLNTTSTTKIPSYEQQDLVLMRGNNKGNINYLVPLSNGCKEPRRSLLIWEPYCIATS